MDMNERLKELAAKYHGEIVKTASEMLQIDSQSLHEKEMAEYTAAKMRQLGYDEVITDRYGSVFGVMKGSGGGCSVTLNCHMDVVEAGDPSLWAHPPFSGAVADGRIWGRGASDTKGTFAIQVYAPAILRDAGLLPKGDVVVAGVVAEEIAGFGSMKQTQEERLLTDYAIVGEATENDISIGSRGRCCPYVTITGKSCHASLPHLGANPFDYLAKLLPELRTVEMGSDELFGSSTMSVTKIVSSENGTNIIPSEIVVYIDYRQAGNDTQDVVRQKLQAVLDRIEVPGVTAALDILYFPLTTYTGISDRGYQGEHPFIADADAPYIQTAKSAVEEAVGHPVRLKPWAFATDTGHYAAKGVKCLGYSPAEIKLCHTTADSISIEMMEEGTIGYLALLETLANQPK